MGGITDQLNGIKDIKSNMLEASRIRWLEDWSERIGGERLEHTRIRMNSQLCYKLAASVIIGCFIYFSVVSFRMQGEQVLLIVLIFSRLWPRFIGIQANLQQIAAAVPAFTALRELQKECFDATEISGGGAAEHDVKPLQIASGIECRNLSFRYEGSAGAYALRGIQLHIRPKEMTAIVGPSGAGKSTLVDILMGLLQPESGQVMIDGQPLTGRNLLSLRRSIGYVPQDPLLFNGTIRDNLLMMEPHATEEELYEALHFAAAGEFVARLPQGLDTMIGDRGIRLSGGERQRLVLARAILRKPSILVLDEATSALDMENEAKIQEALDRLKGHMTLIIIAHRPSTIRNADQVITLEQGRLAGITQAGKEGTAGAETPQSARVVG
ncbi:ABC transporter ATP-binding protein [Paenibacillus sp. TAB 01]|uniref:ABC transporter ATP-binding protein n=1 Tax=Paenibacillus sp. TAB 01 TaxID=3368988 RepID=UPI0038621143